MEMDGWMIKKWMIKDKTATISRRKRKEKCDERKEKKEQKEQKYEQKLNRDFRDDVNKRKNRPTRVQIRK